MNADIDPFSTLADPRRRQILDLLRERPATVSTLVEQLGLSQPGVSKHLKVLRRANLVRVRPDGQKRWYELNPAPLADLDSWLQPYRQFWAVRFDRLEQHLRDRASDHARCDASTDDTNNDSEEGTNR